MATGASIVCVCEGSASGLTEALGESARYPVIETRPADAAKRIAGAHAAAVVLAEPDLAPDQFTAIVKKVEELEGPFVPILAYPCPGIESTTVLPLAREVPPARVAERLTATLRVRALHAKVQRRAGDENEPIASYYDSDCLDEATILVAGRGGGYPALALAVGERAPVIGVLSLESAKRYLDARDIDGVVIGDGFSANAVEGFLDMLRGDPRFRDLAIVVADNRIAAPGLDSLPNADHVRGGPERVVPHLLPLVRLHAFSARLRRWEKSLESKGFVDAETGLLTGEAFLSELTRAVEECGKRSATLSLARFSFDGIDRRIGVDAARIVGRLVRTTDFACLDEDGSLHVVFGDTDLKAGHIVARRIASVLKHTMLAPDPNTPPLNPQISLVTRKPSDTAESLLARAHPAAVAAE